MRIVVGRVSDFQDGDRKIIDANAKSVGIFRIGDEFYALRNRCPHQFGPLCLGTRRGGNRDAEEGGRVRPQHRSRPSSPRTARRLARPSFP
jgi:nitrite reductase/ring-hydroxylating ferredoxin subunit